MKKYIQTNTDAYDKLAKQYEYRLKNKSNYDDIFSTIAELSSKKINTTDLINVLEIGSGSGELLSIFENKGYKTISVELSNKEQFDIIHAGAVIHNFPLKDANYLLKKISCWLKSSGIFTLTTTIEKNSEEGYFVKEDYCGEIVRYRKKWTELEIERTLNENKFNIVDRLCINEEDRDKIWIVLSCEKVK